MKVTAGSGKSQRTLSRDDPETDFTGAGPRPAIAESLLQADAGKSRCCEKPWAMLKAAMPAAGGASVLRNACAGPYTEVAAELDPRCGLHRIYPPEMSGAATGATRGNWVFKLMPRNPQEKIQTTR